MRRKHFFAVLSGLAAIALVAADASAMYHPTLGRWLQRDPIGYADGPSLLEVVSSNPVVGLDPYGLRQITIRFLVTGEMPQTWPGNDTVVEEAIQKVLDTCFKCCQDKVVAKIVQTKQRTGEEDKDSALGLFPKPRPGSWCMGPTQPPPTEWRQEAYSHRDNAVGEIAYTSGPRTSISSTGGDTKLTAHVRPNEHGQTWGNILAHEALYHGMLGENDVLLPGKDTPEMYTKKAPSSHPVEIPKEMCDKLKQMLQVKCEEPRNAK